MEFSPGHFGNNIDRSGRISLRKTVSALFITSFTSRCKVFLSTRATVSRVSNSILGSKFRLVFQNTPALEQSYWYTLQGYMLLLHLIGNYLLCIFNNYSTSVRWIWVRHNHHISNKRERNCFTKNAHKVSRILPDFICKNNRFSACFQFWADEYSYHIWRTWYNGSWWLSLSEL